MNNSIFENNYSKLVEPKFGNKRSISEDIDLLDEYFINEYSISDNERVNLGKHEIYSIDPEGCKDADDAFSIFIENNNLYLAIHIADPTEYINLKSKLWKDIINRTTTKYISNREPIHMLPPKIMNLANLQELDYRPEGTEKNAITIITEIDKDNFVNMPRILENL